MKGDFQDDTFTENDVLTALERAGLNFKNGHRYILSQCPTHEDKHPSVQIYKDDWFVNCHAGCGRYHITKAFPELRSTSQYGGSFQPKSTANNIRRTKEPEVKYKTFDLMAEWQNMPLIPRDHEFKTIPLEVLDGLGWRWDERMQSYFIPYFSASKGSIPFAQWRHLQGDRRFTMLKDAKPTCYGTWNLCEKKIFIVEGTSDGAVMEYAGVPWVALPSAASGELMKAMAGYCKENGIEIIYAGDNDSAGDKLREALDEVAPYRVRQARNPYKDWGEMLEAEGIESVIDYCYIELFPGYTPSFAPGQTMTPLERVQQVFPGAEKMTLTE